MNIRSIVILAAAAAAALPFPDLKRMDPAGGRDPWRDQAQLLLTLYEHERQARIKAEELLGEMRSYVPHADRERFPIRTTPESVFRNTPQKLAIDCLTRVEKARERQRINERVEAQRRAEISAKWETYRKGGAR